jgi:hypothetical protein
MVGMVWLLLPGKRVTLGRFSLTLPGTGAVT